MEPETNPWEMNPKHEMIDQDIYVIKATLERLNGLVSRTIVAKIENNKENSEAEMEMITVLSEMIELVDELTVAFIKLKDEKQSRGEKDDDRQI